MTGYAGDPLTEFGKRSTTPHTKNNRENTCVKVVLNGARTSPVVNTYTNL